MENNSVGRSEALAEPAGPIAFAVTPQTRQMAESAASRARSAADSRASQSRQRPTVHGDSRRGGVAGNSPLEWVAPHEVGAKGKTFPSKCHLLLVTPPCSLNSFHTVYDKPKGCAASLDAFDADCSPLSFNRKLAERQPQPC